MNQIFSAVATILILSGLAFAQTAMRTTTLSLPVGVTDRSINLESLSGISGLSGGQVSTILFVDKEVMYVQSVSGTSAVVNRGQNGSDSTAHNAAATVYVGPPGAYGSRNLSGACTAASWPVTPYININNGNIYTCTSNNWVLQGSGGGSGTLTGCGFGQTLNGTVCDTNTAVIPSNALLQTTSAQICRSTTGNDTYTCTLNPVATSLGNGTSSSLCVVLVADTASSGASTLNVDTLGAKANQNADGTNATILANKPSTLCYDGTQFVVQGGGGSSSSGLTLTSGQYYAPFGLDRSATATIPVANRTYVTKFVPLVNIPATTLMGAFAQTGTASGGRLIGIGDSNCNPLAFIRKNGAAIASTDVLNTSVTLTAGTTYCQMIAIESDTTLLMYQIDTYLIMNPTGIAQQGYCPNATTGTGATYAFPATCGTINTSDRFTSPIIFTAP